MKKRIPLIITIMMMVLMLASCGGGGNGGDAKEETGLKAIAGTWVNTGYDEGSGKVTAEKMKEMNPSYEAPEIEITEDGTCSMMFNGEEMTAKIVAMEDGSYCIDPATDGEMEVTLEGDVLQIDGDGTILYFEKKK